MHIIRDATIDALFRVPCLNQRFSHFRTGVTRYGLFYYVSIKRRISVALAYLPKGCSLVSLEDKEQKAGVLLHTRQMSIFMEQASQLLGRGTLAPVCR